MVCAGFTNGCTCGDCQKTYIERYANSCTYGANPPVTVVGDNLPAISEETFDRLLDVPG